MMSILLGPPESLGNHFNMAKRLNSHCSCSILKQQCTWWPFRAGRLKAQPMSNGMWRSACAGVREDLVPPWRWHWPAGWAALGVLRCAHVTQAAGQTLGNHCCSGETVSLTAWVWKKSLIIFGATIWRKLVWSHVIPIHTFQKLVNKHQFEDLLSHILATSSGSPLARVI